MIQGNGIKKGGLLARMKELTEPMFLLTPLNVIGELALPISLTMRLFGNILAGYIISMLVYTLIKNVDANRIVRIISNTIFTYVF